MPQMRHHQSQLSTRSNAQQAQLPDLPIMPQKFEIGSVEVDKLARYPQESICRDQIAVSVCVSYSFCRQVPMARTPCPCRLDKRTQRRFVLKQASPSSRPQPWVGGHQCGEIQSLTESKEIVSDDGSNQIRKFRRLKFDCNSNKHHNRHRRELRTETCDGWCIEDGHDSLDACPKPDTTPFQLSRQSHSRRWQSPIQSHIEYPHNACGVNHGLPTSNGKRKLCAWSSLIHIWKNYRE